MPPELNINSVTRHNRLLLTTEQQRDSRLKNSCIVIPYLFEVFGTLYFNLRSRIQKFASSFCSKPKNSENVVVCWVFHQLPLLFLFDIFAIHDRRWITVVYCESVNLIGSITAFYLPIENSYASVHIAHHV